MAIYPRTQIPKWQAPIRITRPYIKPNYLADTITSAIQGYGSIQNMNLQQQMFNAKLAQQQKQQDRYDATQAGLQSLYTNQGVPVANAPPAVPNALDDYLPSVNPYGTTTPSPMESVRAAMQANPGANMQTIMAMAGGINALQNPKKTGGMTLAQLASMQHRNRVFDRNEARYQTGLKQDQQDLVKDAGEAASKMIRNVFGNELLPDFKYDPWGINPEPGTEATMKFLQNAEWFDMKGVDAYNAMMQDLQGVAKQMLLQGQDYNVVRAQLQKVYMQGTKKKSSGWQQPEIPALLQEQIEENRAKRDALPTP